MICFPPSVGFMGYAMMNQKGNGLHLRQRSRAFIFAEPENPQNRVVYVSSDICMVYQMVLRVFIATILSYSSSNNFSIN